MELNGATDVRFNKRILTCGNPSNKSCRATLRCKLQSDFGSYYNAATFRCVTCCGNKTLLRGKFIPATDTNVSRDFSVVAALVEISF